MIINTQFYTKYRLYNVSASGAIIAAATANSRRSSQQNPYKTLCFIGRAWPNFPWFYSTFRKNPNKKVPQVWALCLFLGLGWPWVGEFVGFIIIFLCFPTQNNRPKKTQVVGLNIRRLICSTSVRFVQYLLHRLEMYRYSNGWVVGWLGVWNTVREGLIKFTNYSLELVWIHLIDFLRRQSGKSRTR